jgi:hypothetical protein
LIRGQFPRAQLGEHRAEEAVDLGDDLFAVEVVHADRLADEHAHAVAAGEELALGPGAERAVDDGGDDGDLGLADHQRDKNRSVGPLSIPVDAEVIDTTSLTQDQVIAHIVDRANAVAAAKQSTGATGASGGAAGGGAARWQR